jgi:uncharacterized protein
MNTTPQNLVTARPVDTAERIKTIDIVRGVALLGILLMNIPGFGMDWGDFDPIRRGPHNTANFRTMQVIEVFFSGTMRGLFSMLFGAGMILFTMNKKDTPGGITVGELYYRRLLLLVMFGVFNAYVLLWWGDILYAYGIAGMILYPFRKTGAKWLMLLGIVCIFVGIWRTQIWYNETREQRAKYTQAVKAKKEGKKLTDEQQQAIASWTEQENWRPEAQRRERNVQKMNSDYGTVFTHMLPRNSGSESWGGYFGIWDSLCMMFVGMALFRLGFFSNVLSTSTYGMGLLLGYAIGIPIGWFFLKGELDMLQLGKYVDTYSVPYWALYDFKRLFLSIGHASLIMLIFRSRIVPWLMRALANVGQMAFSNYLIQSIICTLFFYGYGLGYYGKLHYHQLYYVVAVVWLFNIIFSVVWLQYFRFGPFEWLWRSLTYWKKQPFKK